MKKVLYISSTGGHLEELLKLKPLFDVYEYHIVTEKTPSNSDLKDKYKGHVTYLPYGTQDHLIPYLFIFPYNIIKSLFIFLIQRPDVIVTTGTHTAVPMCHIAHLFKKKVVWIETFANKTTPTKAGRMVYNIADLFVVQWPDLLKFYPKAKVFGWIF